MCMEGLQAINNDIYEDTERFATGWTDRGLNPGGGDIFRTRPDQTWGPFQPSVQLVPVSFPAVKRLGRDVDYPPPSSLKVKERVELYITFPLVLDGLYWGALYLYYYKHAELAL